MPRTKVTFDTVREIGLALPEVEDSAAYGAFALKLRGRLLACKAINKSAEPESLVVWIGFDQTAGLLAEAPETYYLTDHYVNYPVVLVRLSKVRIDELRDLLNGAWRFVSALKKRTTKRPTARKLKTAKRKSRQQLP